MFIRKLRRSKYGSSIDAVNVQTAISLPARVVCRFSFSQAVTLSAAIIKSQLVRVLSLQKSVTASAPDNGVATVKLPRVHVTASLVFARARSWPMLGDKIESTKVR